METSYNNCEICLNKGFDSATGVICKLTNEKPPVEYTCGSFDKDKPLAKDLAWKNKLKEKDMRITRVKKRLTIGTIISVLIFGYLILRAIGQAIGEGVARGIGSLFH